MCNGDDKGGLNVADGEGGAECAGATACPSCELSAARLVGGSRGAELPEEEDATAGTGYGGRSSGHI